MTRDSFISIEYDLLDHKHPTVEMEGKVYEVTDTDRMGRMKLERITYRLNDGRFDFDYDTYDDASEALSDRVDNADDDDEDVEELVRNGIDEVKTGKPFWMHYKDIEEG